MVLMMLYAFYLISSCFIFSMAITRQFEAGFGSGLGTDGQDGSGLTEDRVTRLFKRRLFPLFRVIYKRYLGLSRPLWWSSLMTDMLHFLRLLLLHLQKWMLLSGLALGEPSDIGTSKIWIPRDLTEFRIQSYPWGGCLTLRDASSLAIAQLPRRSSALWIFFGPDWRICRDLLLARVLLSRGLMCLGISSHRCSVGGAWEVGPGLLGFETGDWVSDGDHQNVYWEGHVLSWVCCFLES